MQLVCRDRNRLALQADIMGAALHGIENVCCLTGDDVTAGDEPEARRVFDLDGPQLIALATALAPGATCRAARSTPRRTCSSARSRIRARRRTSTASERALKKVEAGARFLQLQVCFEPELLEAFMAEAVAAGLAERGRRSCPERDHRPRAGALRYIDEHVPGIDVPAAMIERASGRRRPAAECSRTRAASSPRTRMSLPGVAGMHLICFRRDARHRTPVPAPRHPNPRGAGDSGDSFQSRS